MNDSGIAHSETTGPESSDHGTTETASTRRRRAMAPVAAVAVVGLAAIGASLVVGLGAADESPGARTPIQGAAASSGTTATTSGTAAADRAVIPAVRTMGYCYRTADITVADLDQHVLIGVSGDAPDGRGDLVGRITDICRTSWEQNLYGFHPVQEGVGKYPVPELATCVLTGAAAEAQEGAIAVFPGGPTTCAALGLPTART